MLQGTMGYMWLFQFWFPQGIPRVGIDGSLGGFIPSFLRNLHNVFHRGCINLQLYHWQCKSVPFSPHPLQDLLFIDFLKMPFWPVRWYFVVVLICISLIMSNVKHLFMCLSLCLLWRNVYLGHLPTFWLGCLFFWDWVAWAACIFWRLILC